MPADRPVVPLAALYLITGGDETVRLSIVLLLCSLAGVLGGAALCGTVALGLAIIADSVAVGVYALLRDPERRPAPSVHEVPTLAQVLERARAS